MFFLYLEVISHLHITANSLNFIEKWKRMELTASDVTVNAIPTANSNILWPLSPPVVERVLKKYTQVHLKKLLIYFLESTHEYWE